MIIMTFFLVKYLAKGASTRVFRIMLIFFLLCYSSNAPFFSYYATVMYALCSKLCSVSIETTTNPQNNPNRTTVEELKVFPFLEDVILNLKAELAQYLGLADGVAKVDLLD